MACWLVKTEPDSYAYADLARDGRARWDGVANAAACGHLRAMREGDLALVYHTGSEKRVAGLARVASEPYEDPSAPGRDKQGRIARPVVDLVPVAQADPALTLADIKADPALVVDGFDLVRLPRLSVMPVPEPAAGRIRALTGL